MLNELAGSTILLQLLTFILTAIGLSVLLVEPVRKGIRDRRDAIKGELDEVAERKAEAERLRDEYAAKVRAAEDERARILQQAYADASATKASIEEQGRATAEKLVADATRQIAADRRRVYSELKDQLGTAAVKLAGQIIEKELSPASHQAMVESFLTQLEAEK